MQPKAQKSTFNNFSDLLIRTDMYSQFVHLSFQGRKKIYTLAGLLATLTVMFIILGFATFKGIILFQRTQFETQMASVLRPIDSENPEIFQINEYGFNFAVKATSPMSPEIGSLVLIHQKMEIIYDEELGKNVTSQTEDEIETELCTYELFNHTDRDEFDTKQISNYYCIKNKSEMRLGGSYSSSRYEALQIKLMGCQNGTDIVCASQETIDAFMAYQYLVFRFIDKYFDKDQMTDPIRSYINDQYYFGSLLDQTQWIDFKVKISKAIYDEELSPWSFEKTVEFPQVDDMFTTYSTMAPGYPYIQIGIKLDFFSNIYQKNLFSFMDYVSQLGGLFNALYGAGRLFIFLFMDTYILQKIISVLFSYTDNEIDQGSEKLKRAYNIDPNAKKSPLDQQILSEAISRKPVDIGKGKIDCFLFRICRSSSNASKRKLRLLQQGRKKLRYDLDIVALFKMMQEFKLVKKLMFSQNQRVMFKWHKSFTIQSGDESESDCEEFRRRQNGIERKNPLQKLCEYDKLNDAVQDALSNDQRSNIDNMLLQGIVKKRRDCQQEEKDSQEEKKKDKVPNKRAPKLSFGLKKKKTMAKAKNLDQEQNESIRALQERHELNRQGLQEKRNSKHGLKSKKRSKS